MTGNRAEDKRGVIQDLLGAVDSVAEIRTAAGAVRGNHVHHRTVQWVYIVSGLLQVAWGSEPGDGVRTAVLGPGVLHEEPAGIPHAWKALRDTTVLMFTRGPRAGSAYESDTARLEVPLLTGTTRPPGSC